MASPNAVCIQQKFQCHCESELQTTLDCAKYLLAASLAAFYFPLNIYELDWTGKLDALNKQMLNGDLELSGKQKLGTAAALMRTIMQINYESPFTMQRNENFYGVTSAILIL